MLRGGGGPPQPPDGGGGDDDENSPMDDIPGGEGGRRIPLKSQSQSQSPPAQ
jgi:hypothetical protein